MQLVKQIEAALEFAYLAKKFAAQSEDLKIKSLEYEAKSKQLLSAINLDDSKKELTDRPVEDIPVFHIKYPKVREVQHVGKPGTVSTNLEYALNPFGKSHV